MLKPIIKGGKKMSKTLKWVLYVLLGLVVVALLAVAVYVIFSGGGYGMMVRPGIPWDGHMNFNYSPLRWIFGSLLCLGVFLLVILGIVAFVAALVRGNRPISSPPAAPMATAERPCPNCGRMTQADWKNCPHCGSPLT